MLTDLFSKVIDLGDERALFDLQFPPVLLEVANRAGIHLGLRTTDALQPTHVFAQTSEHLPHGACLLFDIACVERGVRLERTEAVHDSAIDGFACVYVWRRWS